MAATLNGQPLPAEQLSVMRLLLFDESYLVKIGEARDEGKVKRNETVTPQVMEITGTAGPNAGRTLHAIYELNGDELQICYALQGDAPPSEFKAEAGSGQYLASYRRLQRVTGIGGVFFKAQDSAKLRLWYQEHLGITSEDFGGGTYGTAFNWRSAIDSAQMGSTIWSVFAAESKYFDQPLMLNYRVDDIDAVLEQLRAEGVWIDEKREDGEFGRFAWIKDAEGARIELWEPPKEGGCL
jgi:uncharacterized protein (TIGR03067 family)